jgi:hypothetical protein
MVLLLVLSMEPSNNNSNVVVEIGQYHANFVPRQAIKS